MMMMMMRRMRMRMIMMMMTHCHHHQFGLPHFSVHNRKSSAQAIFGIMIIAAIHGSDYLLVVGFSFFNLFSPFPELNASWLIPRLTCFIYFRQPRFFCATTNSFQNNHFGDKTTRCWCFLSSAVYFLQLTYQMGQPIAKYSVSYLFSRMSQISNYILANFFAAFRLFYF